MILEKHILYVLYRPIKRRIPPAACVLSFMSPYEEQNFSAFSGFLYGRKEMDTVREKTRKLYLDLIARIGATPCHGKTLRQVLQLKNKGNPWWYHRLSEKQCEADDTFNLLLQIFTILDVAEREGVNKIIACSAPREVSLVLRKRYQVKHVGCRRNLRNHPLRGILSRFRYLYTAAKFYLAVKCAVSLPQLKPDVIFQGFWDWSVFLDKDKNIRDSYFKRLPAEFLKSAKECAWFLWLDPHARPGKRDRNLSEILQTSKKQGKLIFVQKFLKISDIFCAVLDFRPLYRYLCFAGSGEFRALFKEAGCDLWPLVSQRLPYSFCGANMAHYFLMETAYRRAFAFYRPKTAVTFLELFNLSRAFYQGARFGSPQTLICNMQHASYGREKTFILADRERELLGRPDSQMMPVPDYLFAMGELCRDILIEDGFPAERVVLSGSSRFEHISIANGKQFKSGGSRGINVLLAATLNLKLEFEMVEAAFLAAEGLNIKLTLRSHPFARIEDLPAWRPYSKSIISSSSSLEEDLNNADLVLFIYSTVAEEAYLKGIPVLQWAPLGFNGSVFRDIGLIPGAYSVETLRDKFKLFISNPASFKPSRENQELVLAKCFYRADNQASQRIAEKISEVSGR